MKTLHIVRHGKSSWEMPGISDLDRPLIQKGISNSYLMAENLLKKYDNPDLILSSPANRALHTAIIFARVAKLKINFVQIVEEIYETGSSNIIEIVEETSNKVNNLIIVGHNPTFTELANLFLPVHLDNLPTSGRVTLQFDSKDWNIINKTPEFSEVDFPKKE